MGSEDRWFRKLMLLFAAWGIFWLAFLAIRTGFA